MYGEAISISLKGFFCGLEVSETGVTALKIGAGLPITKLELNSPGVMVGVAHDREPLHRFPRFRGNIYTKMPHKYHGVTRKCHTKCIDIYNLCWYTNRY